MYNFLYLPAINFANNEHERDEDEPNDHIPVAAIHNESSSDDHAECDMEQNMAIYDNVDSAENNMPQSGDLSSDIQRKANENGESESTKVDNFATDRLSDSKQNDDSNTDVDTIYYSVVSTYEEPENNIILPESLIFIARGKEDALVTLNITPGVAVYGEKRISVEAPPGPDGNAVKVEYRVWNPFRSKCKLSLSFHAD